MPNWIELPVNPPNARKIQIHNLSAGTTYEFQVSTVQYSTVLYSTVLYSTVQHASPCVTAEYTAQLR